MSVPTAPARYRCPWCGAETDPHNTSCPACGSPVDVRATVATDSGWYELPPIKDMAKLQFGQSFCQIEGMYVPVADVELAAGDRVYFTHHLLLWKDTRVVVETMPLKGGWQRLFAGLPLIMTQAFGPGHIAFSRDEPGEMIAIPLHPGQTIDVREHVFMVATGSVQYDWFNTDIWFQTQQNSDDGPETHYPIGMYMDRFQAGQQPGLLILHGAGNVFVRTLQPGQTILIKPTALLYKDTAVNMNLHFEYPGNTWQSWRTWGNRYLWLRVTGPGRVAVQSSFTQIEDPGYNLAGWPYDTTQQQW